MKKKRKQIVYWQNIENFSEDDQNGENADVEEYDDRMEHEIEVYEFQQKIDDALLKTVLEVSDTTEKQCFSLFARYMNVHNVSKKMNLPFQRVKNIYEKFILIFSKNLLKEDFSEEKIHFVEKFFREKRKKI